jgi:rubredoxin
MPTSSDCPACGADKSYQTLELDRPGAIFCTQCGHVLTEVELSDNGFESWKLSARNPPIFDQTNAADPSFIRYSSKTFEVYYKSL